jgi:hypothetical protein
MKAVRASQARRPRFSRAISAIESAPWRTEATSAVKSCTAPMRITPNTIHRTQGTQPQSMQAAIGPTMGPAAAIALKCWPIR